MSRRRSVVDSATPAVFVLLWSTGFVGAKYGLPYAEPFTFLLIRLLLAGGLLALLAVLLRASWPQGGHWRAAVVAGTLLHAGYLGGVFYAISLGVPASVAAVVVSLQPVLTAALGSRFLGESLQRRQWMGLTVGLLGVALVLAPGLGAAASRSDGLTLTGLLACAVALAAGTAGTLWQKRHGDGVPLLSGTAVQYAAAAPIFALLAFTTETRVVQWTGEFVAALAWLVLVLSLGAVLLLLVLLRRGTAAGVSSLFYLVPPATAVQAYLLFGETLAPLSVVGIAVVTVGVALVLVPSRHEPTAIR